MDNYVEMQKYSICHEFRETVKKTKIDFEVEF